MAFTTATVRVTALVLLFAIFLNPGECLRCFKCNSDNEPSCENTPKEASDCDNLPQLKEITMGMLDIKPVCLKAIVKDKNSGRRIVLRDCVVDMSVMKTCDVANALKLPEAAEIEVCETCDTDLCNGSSQVSLSTVVIVLPCIISFIYSYLQ